MSKYKRKQGDWDKKGSKDDPKVLIGFAYIDVTQGQSFRKWNENSELLLKLIEITHTLNKLTYSQAITQSIIEEYDVNDKTKFTVNNMPCSSKWKYPKTLSNNNVKWCKIRLGSTRRVIGFMEKNLFQVVFLDKDHEFYPTEPHNT